MAHGAKRTKRILAARAEQDEKDAARVADEMLARHSELYGKAWGAARAPGMTGKFATAKKNLRATLARGNRLGSGSALEALSQLEGQQAETQGRMDLGRAGLMSSLARSELDSRRMIYGVRKQGRDAMTNYHSGQHAANVAGEAASKQAAANTWRSIAGLAVDAGMAYATGGASIPASIGKYAGGGAGGGGAGGIFSGLGEKAGDLFTSARGKWARSRLGAGDQGMGTYGPPQYVGHSGGSDLRGVKGGWGG